MFRFRINSETVNPFIRLSGTTWTGDSLIARLYIGQHNTKRHTSMPQTEFEPTIPVLELSKPYAL
jgi:hypothetical protein